MELYTIGTFIALGWMIRELEDQKEQLITDYLLTIIIVIMWPLMLGVALYDELNKKGK